ncbi:acyl-homoserine-lactone acylase [Variovorax boronicumulans]|uniref:penicillin acylase family protein n=1 Tax=Variovorax boronicumulans TaxID=436515 RepID=UPI002788D74F|nr:penicillin acylase family protein [Variovorax boronicumulans]MDP9992748.1 acyl-homoserine-lactone acylase [Variovorax boronicumulans]MDQ0004161.1 acyl-homoserine-lactone acylase [Variovorax boronicumulans]
MTSNTPISRFPLTAFRLSVLGLAALLGACASAPPSSGRSVTIERTTYGIAHITASDYEGLAYGTAYAHAQDNVCQTAEHLLTLRGERSQFLGAQNTGEIGLGRAPNAQIDLFIRYHMDDEALARAGATTSLDVKAALRSYVAGYNRYLQDAGPNGLPAACRGKPWVRPMTMADLSRATEMSMIQGGLGALAGAVLAAVPPAPVAAGVKTGAAPADLKEAVAEIGRHSFNANPEGGELGSNGWAFGRNATPDGRGLLLGNPHFPWNGTNRFWQMHLTIPGQLDVMGASGGLSPVVAIGFNKDVAWTHTVSTGKRFTLYELKLDPNDPTVYLIDGQPKKMVARTVVLPAAATGGGAPVQHTFYATDWGPVISLPRAGLGWTAQKAYAIRDANTLNVRSAESWMRMARARNVTELRAAMGNQGMPWINTIAADRDGNAMYADLSVVPDVSAGMLQACAPSPAAAALLGAAGLPILDGSRSACAWNRDITAAAPGVIAPARMPVVVTPDYVQNSNDSFWLSNPRIAPMAGVSPLVGPIGVPQRLRTRSGIMEIEGRLAGTDGLPGNRMGAAELRSVIFRDRNLAGMLVMDDLQAACAAGGAALNADQALGCRVLSAWDRTSNADSKGAALFREFWRKAKDLPKVWRVPFDPAQPVATPAGLDMATPATREAVFKALGDAVGIVRTAGFAADVPLGVPQSREVRGQKIALHGGDEFEGVLNKLESQGQSLIDPKGYNVNYGSSYMQVVTFDERGPVAQGLLTYGQSSDLASPRAYDQLPLFAAKQWHALPFHPADVQAQREGQPIQLAY